MINPLTPIKAKTQLAALKVLLKVVTPPRPLVILGESSSIKLCNNISMLGAKRILIVTDAVLYQLGVTSPIEAELEGKGIKCSVFSAVTPDPTLSVVTQGLQALSRFDADAVLAIGGGSSIDAAKVIACAAANNTKPENLFGVFKAKEHSLPLFVIPTTAGTGSEVTMGAVISDDESHQKSLIIDPKIVPLAVALDPIIMKGMPPSITADTGLDALTHAVEAWVSDMASEESDRYAFASIQMVFKYLLTAYQDGENLEAREAMGLASHYAGLAINKAGIGYVHAIAHQLGALYGISHGRSNAIVLPHVLDFNNKASSKRLAKLAQALNIVDSNAGVEVACNAFISRTKKLINELNVDMSVPNIDRKDFDKIADSAFTEAHGIYAVPKYMSRREAKLILHAIKNTAKIA
ncbi:hypothetical protein A9Q81_20610 [Gammaproteobacteria bacterium 42_54_T18]|nr:hypothetical protein A9Q81_20610 [Gammaproteobacteria bacterium 42_54_T18]